MKRLWAWLTIVGVALALTFTVVFIAKPVVKAYPQFDLIDTYAGTGERGFVGDGLNAFIATLYNPIGLHMDMVGNLYIADMQNNRIRRVDPSMVMTTIAGNGDFGYSGDEFNALAASFAFPMGLHVITVNQRKKTVNAYIADTRNNRVRRVNRYGVITSVCGDGTYLYSGDRGPATKASLAWPSSVYVDTFHNIYIADTGNNAIRVIINPKNPSAIRGDAASEAEAALRVAGITNGQEVCRPNFIYKVAGTTVRGYAASGRPRYSEGYQAGVPNDYIKAVDVNINRPFDVQVVWPDIIDPKQISSGYNNERVYFSDTGNHIIRYVNHDGCIVRLAGIPGIPGYNGDILSATNEKLNQPLGIWVDPDDQFLYVADSANRRIRVISINHEDGQLQSRIKTLAGNGFFGFSGDGSDAKMARLSRPQDICGDPLSFDVMRSDDNAFASQGRPLPTLFISDVVNQRIRYLELNGYSGPDTTGQNGGDRSTWGGYHDLDQEVWCGRYWEDDEVNASVPQEDWPWGGF